MLTCLKKAIPFWSFILSIQQIESWKIYYLQNFWSANIFFQDTYGSFVILAEKTLKMGIMTRFGAIVMLMSWLYPSCTHFQRAVYFVLDIALNITQSKENVILR